MILSVYDRAFYCVTLKPLLVLMLVCILSACATAPNTSNDAGESPEEGAEVETNDQASTLEVDRTEWEADRRAIEEQFRSIMAGSYELEVLLEVEELDGAGLTPSQERLSEKVETALIDFLMVVEAEWSLDPMLESGLETGRLLMPSEDGIDTVRDPELKAWAALRWGQMNANYSCILSEVRRAAGYAKHLPREQARRQRRFGRETGHSRMSWIAYFEAAKHLDVGQWSKVASEWLAVREEEEYPMLTICGEKVDELRGDEQVGTSARQEACSEGYRWSCEWLEEEDREWEGNE